MTQLKDLYEYLDYLDNCSDGQFLKFVDAMEKRGYKFVTQYVHDYDYPHVTHCKDCKFSKAYYHGSESNLGMFTYLCTQGLYGMNPDDYCSRAEKK